MYDGLAEHIAQARLSTQLARNHWNTPIAITNERGNGNSPGEENVGHGAGKNSGCSLLAPARFLPFHIPMDVPASTMRGEGASPLCELPSEYSTVLLTHVQRLVRARDEIATLSCTEELRRAVQATVQGGFNEWLQRTGNARQVVDLMAQTSW